MKTVLIIEDDTTLLKVLADNFGERGYHVEIAGDGKSGLNKAMQLRPDLLILDIMLPIVNGYELCQALRREDIKIPVIMLTAKTDESDVVLGLGLGADDYLTKPFSIRELMARSEAVLRRTEQEKSQPSVTTFGIWTLDTEAHELQSEGQTVELSPKEYDLLAYFASKPGKALSRDEIMNAVWGFDSRVTSRSIDRFVRVLRKKIEPDPANPTFIKTIREFG
ncbi:MAG: response regulator transcription factor, partial [Verrucomicrobiota bacterium]